MDPFAMALDAQFNAPGSMAAVYMRTAGPVLPVRVIRSQPDQTSAFGAGRIIQATNLIEIRRSEVEKPEIDDLIVIDEVTFQIVAEPMLDVEGMTWTCGADMPD